MSGTVLILGASGRFGRAAAMAFADDGWEIQTFDRKLDNLQQAAQGVDLIVNGWNPLYPDWKKQVPGLHQQVIDAARASGATVLLPGNVYVFGSEVPGPWNAESPHLAQNPLGRIRVQMEKAYRQSGVRTIILRAGDFLDTEASGNWFDAVLTAKLSKGKFVYPGDPDVPHAWAYLPDLARAAVGLANQRSHLPQFCDVPFHGYTLTGRQMSQAIDDLVQHPVAIQRMAWWPLNLARPFWPLARGLFEMRYLWNLPHSLDASPMESLMPEFEATPLELALSTSLQLRTPTAKRDCSLGNGDVNPHQPVAAGG